jgi:hypothetical protein
LPRCTWLHCRHEIRERVCHSASQAKQALMPPRSTGYWVFDLMVGYPRGNSRRDRCTLAESWRSKAVALDPSPDSSRRSLASGTPARAEGAREGAA